MNDTTRNQIAEALENLAAQPVWNDEVWKHCYDLVSDNMDDELVAYVHDDLIHCSGTPLFSFGNNPKHPDFAMYKQEFRDVAVALRSHMSWQEYKRINNIYETGETRAAISSFFRRTFLRKRKDAK